MTLSIHGLHIYGFCIWEFKQPWIKILYLTPVLVAHACNPSYLGVRDREDRGSRPAAVNKVRPYLKNTQHKKRAGGVAQMVQHLPSKHKALSSNPSTKKNFKYCNGKYLLNS
jgi:hypothetical protein